ncbi:mediator of RNA polymerase II transcription subunit 12 [Aspergillus pseudotamarii]|uniref:Mediator of RNA polymerase II transcription subunit 12 n=1 Tax=Aspergillus pseudotamarii TaxID=132259 RepID=A0A5N6T1E4_ASPPS|nr:mediator of RNA polymerase II transcription subunit 12 [Aspergillus pseudotamarii]KAE8139634.1 mediator of RNA polymerase II transcription subunit 12 [Aspergillus pseudotamarii]
MIPHSSAGVQSWGHPLRAVNSGSGHVDASQAVRPSDPQFEKLPTPVPQPQPRQPAVIDLTTSGGDAQEVEPPPKRLRLDLPVAPSAQVASPAPGSGGELRSTPGTGGSKPPSLSWRNRPVWSFQAMLSEVPGSNVMNEETAVAQGGKPASPPSLPVLPWKYVPESLGSNPATSRASSPVKEVQTIPYRIETPSVAPVLKGEKVADFSPWTGNHPEDVLNEQTAKQGHYDRTQVSQNESNTARPSLYAQLKHRSGLQMLSSVFAAALEKRQSHSMVNAPSTFKPPPRVTLTDNKREAWLRDLANPSVPLRKLSRTIPHGIRGKSLLDQCLNKGIPVSRAVWLAKCVGANEIRAFKRKGTSGTLALGLEAKWVRDWTATVQQFLEGVLGACGSAQWKMKMTYAVSLTARLFFERLLDHDQYLGWFLSSLEAAPVNTVPVWLLMLGIYWDNIMRYRKRGRRLAELLLVKLRQVTQPEKVGQLQPLVDRLSLYVRRLVLEHTSSMVLPGSWENHKELISSCLNLNDNIHKTIYQNLSERNSRLQLPKNYRDTAERSPQQRVIQLFDSIRSAHDISSASATCLKTIEDKAVLISKLLEWTATPFRYGLCRVYTGVRLLRKWKMSGIDVDSYILSFLTDVRVTSALNMEHIYHIISELVRSQTFSVGRYLQWLMAKGVTNTTQPVSSDYCLLKQLPANRLPEHVRNLRNTLLYRAGITVMEEDSAIAELKISIAQRLPNIFGAEMDSAMPTESSEPNPTWAVKSEIGQWIRRGVAEHCRDSPRYASLLSRCTTPANSYRKLSGVSVAVDLGVSALTPDEFYSVREILETFGDLSMLADILKHATHCDDDVVLASVADTVNFHFDCFSVIGATSDLFRGLVESYARLKKLGNASLDLLFSLIELGLRIPSEFNTVALLRQDLTRLESKSALAAPSPLSDSIPLALSDVDPSFQEKLNQLLSSGGGMDESTMDTVFYSLIHILESSGSPAKLSANETARYLAYLRPFQPKHFDTMLIRWICGLLKSSTPSMSRILPPLIGVGCVTIHAFVFLVKKLLQSEKVAAAIPNLAGLRVDLLQLLIPLVSGKSKYADLVTYRFYVAQQEFFLKHPQETLDIICDAVALVDSESGLCSGQPDISSCAIDLLNILLTQNPEVTVQYCLQGFIGKHSTSTAVLQRALDNLLGFDSLAGPCTMSEAERVVRMTDDFSLPFCQLKLQMLFNAESSRTVGNGIVDVMFKAAVEDTRSKGSNWVGFVGLMSQDVIRQRAERALFSIPLFEEHLEAHGPSGTAKSLETAKLYLTIIEKLAYSVPEAGVQSVAPVLVEKMDLLLHRLVIMQTNFNNVTANRHGAATTQILQSRSNFERALAFWFSAFLRMIVIHRSAFTAPSPAPKLNGLQEQSRLLTSTLCISLARLPDSVIRLFPAADYFPHPIPSQGYRPCPGILLQTHALDVAASLIDTFPDEARQHCARFLKERCPPFLQYQNDSRFIYLLGPMSDAAALNSLQAASLPSPAAGGSTPTPTPPAITPAGTSASLSEGINCVASHLRLQYRGRVMGPYPVRPWELLEDAAPIVGVNDTAVNLKYFDARRVRA